MGIKGKLVAEYAKDHSYYEVLDFMCHLIGLDSDSGEVLKKAAETADSPVEFWTNLPPGEQKNIKSMEELESLYNRVKSEMNKDKGDNGNE